MTLHALRRDIRTHDYDRYVCCLFEPAQAQPHAWALLAFNQELAKTSLATTEEAVGAIRLKWWYDALQALAAAQTPPQHPVLQLLAQHVATQEYAQLVPLVEARMQEIQQRKGFATKQQFDEYLQQTGGKLHALLSKAEGEAASIIAQAGAFYALVGCLRAMPFHLQQGVVRQPLDVLQRYGISPAAIEQGLEKEAFAHLMSYWMQSLKAQAEAITPALMVLPKRYTLAKRLHVTALLHAKALIKTQGNPATLPVQLPALAAKLCWHAVVGAPKL